MHNVKIDILYQLFNYVYLENSDIGHRTCYIIQKKNYQSLTNRSTKLNTYRKFYLKHEFIINISV